MIVRPAGDDLLLITQPDHARLSAAIMEGSAALARHPRRASIMLAIAEHDNGWAEEDAAPRIDLLTGFPVDFVSAPAAARQAVWPRGVARLSHDPWAAALVAQHAITIFERYRGDSSWAWFFEEMETTRLMMKNASGRSFDDLAADYTFLGLGDLISLTFCNGWSDVQRFGQWSIQLSGAAVAVRPDPFGAVTIPVVIEARRIPRRAFGSDAELRDAMAAARAATLQGIVSG